MPFNPRSKKNLYMMSWALIDNDQWFRLVETVPEPIFQVIYRQRLVMLIKIDISLICII